jgi:hypothetical protein
MACLGLETTKQQISNHDSNQKIINSILAKWILNPKEFAFLNQELFLRFV